jgi:hypothetical protein
MPSRISTGGGTSARQHYEHGEQVLFQAERPIILNGISPSGIGEDMLDRSIAIRLPRLTRKTRLPRREIEESFNAALPRVLGGLYKAVSAALRNQASTSVQADLRMLDGAIFVTAAEEELGWKKGTFVRAYRRNRRAIVQRAIEEDPVASAVVELVRAKGDWDGTATDLLDALDPFHTGRSRRDWPKGANSLSRRLEEIAPFLRMVGIEIERDKETGKDRTRLIFISRKRRRPKLKKRNLRIGKKLLKRRAKKGMPG